MSISNWWDRIKSRFNFFKEKPKEDYENPKYMAAFTIQRLHDKYCKNKKGKCSGCFGKPKWMRSEKVVSDWNKPKAGNIARDLRRKKAAELLTQGAE